MWIFRLSLVALMSSALVVTGCNSSEKDPAQADEDDADDDDDDDSDEGEDDDTSENTEEATATPQKDASSAMRDAQAGGKDAGMRDADQVGVLSDASAMDAGAADTGSVTLGEPSCEPEVDPLPLDVALPIVFIHGFAGSAQQYESQAMRFVANGYPIERIRALDHDGEGLDTNMFVTQADQLIDEVRSELGVDKVYLVGHSRGTFVSSSYLGTAQRAAKVAKYVSLDGSGCSAAMSAGVPCDAPSQANLSGHKHVEVATSAESFKRQFQFLIGKPPTIVDLVAQDAPIEISGRAVNFPANTGRAGVTLEIWELDSATGHRATGTALATFEIDASGDWGPLVVDPRKHYELVLMSDELNHHFYPQPFLRCNRLVRLLSGPADSESRVNTNTGDGHAALVAMRMREWMTTDVLEIGTKSASGGDQAAVNAIVSSVGDANIAIFLHDDTGSPKRSSLSALAAFTGGAFQAGVDVYMPASDPPDGTITLTNMPRGDRSKPQVLNVPNWASTNHTVTVMFSDFPQQ